MNHSVRELGSCGTGAPPAHGALKHGRDARAAGRVFAFLAFPLLMLLFAGCHEPDYRTEVVGNGEGGVEIHRVPKDPSEMNTQQQQSSPPATKSPLEQRVEVLEATVLRQQEEIATLRRELNAKGPATTAP